MVTDHIDVFCIIDLIYIDVLCIIDLMVLQHRADTEDSVAAVIRDMCSFEFLDIGI